MKDGSFLIATALGKKTHGLAPWFEKYSFLFQLIEYKHFFSYAHNSLLVHFVGMVWQSSIILSFWLKTSLWVFREVPFFASDEICGEWRMQRVKSCTSWCFRTKWATYCWWEKMLVSQTLGLGRQYESFSSVCRNHVRQKCRSIVTDTFAFHVKFLFR